MARLSVGECCDDDNGSFYAYDNSSTSPSVNVFSGGAGAGSSSMSMPSQIQPGAGRIIQTQPIQQVQPTELPVIPSQVMPAPTTMTMPGMVATAQVMGPNPKPDLTPQDLIKPLPTIVDNQPTQIAQCNSFSEWLDQNPMLAGGLLLGLAWFVFGKKE
jgi:hypothetical protein